MTKPFDPTLATALLRRASASLRHLGRSRRGALGVAMALLAVPVIMTIGAAVDYARLEQFKTQLQSTVDSAALSGAAVYQSAADSSNASTVAQNYINANVNYLPGHVGSVTSNVSTTQVTTGSNQGYTVTVSATAKIGTTFMQLVTPTLSVSATAVAVNPIVQITMSVGSFKSSAADGNTLYYWLVSQSNPGAIPAPTSFTSSQFLASNASNSNNQTITITATATQQIGIALKNVTGQIADYGCNQYQTAPGQWEYVQNKGGYGGYGGYGGGYGGYGGGGSWQWVTSSCQGTTQWLYSNLMPPHMNSYDVSSVDTGYQNQPKNCSLETTITSTAPTILTAPISGQCFTSLPQDSVPSCAMLNGRYVNLYWNDMGGNTDDYDYNDAEISINCSGVSGSGNSATNVYLAQ
jgi:Flp pilus assembly protein TadG